jgi:hypothetical protein
MSGCGGHASLGDREDPRGGGAPGYGEPNSEAGSTAPRSTQDASLAPDGSMAQDATLGLDSGLSGADATEAENGYDGGEGDANEDGGFLACVGVGSWDWDGGTVCSTLIDIGPAITNTCATSPEPTGTGGVIVGGTYVMTKYIVFSCLGDAAAFEGGTLGNELRSETFSLQDGCLQGAGHIDGVANWQTASLAVSGNMITPSLFCPSSQLDAPFTYTAEGVSLTFYLWRPHAFFR